jgi:hypothetical protein
MVINDDFKTSLIIIKDDFKHINKSLSTAREFVSVRNSLKKTFDN